MEITDPPKPSGWYILIFIIAFSVMGFTALYYAVIVSIELVTEVSSQIELITFEKGAFYLFGVGGGLLTIVFNIVYSGILKKELPDFLHVLLTRLLIGSVVLTFALPQIVHITIEPYLEDQGYQICREKSHRWLHVVTIVYTKNLPCSEE